MRAEDRMRRLNALALGLALSYALFAIQFVADQKTVGPGGVTQKGVIVSPVVDFLFIYITSAGLYKGIVSAIFRLVSSSQTLLRLYWGNMYVAGLWSYRYTIDGTDGADEYFGIWRFRQTMFGTSVVGFGLTNDFRIRSQVRSLTDLVEYHFQFEVVNVRSDSVDAGEYYSRTTMYFETKRHRLLRLPTRMTGKTFIYGGPLTGKICSNTFVRHREIDTEQDLIEWLKKDRTPKPGGAESTLAGAK